MNDRIPNDPGVAPPPREDTTARVVARILRAKPKVVVGAVNPVGMIRFTLMYRPLRITSQEIRDMALLRRQLLADFLGKFLIQTNLDVFLPRIAECDDFATHVRKYPIQHVGLYIDDFQLVFEINIGLLYAVLNEELAKWIEGEKATVAWSWKFFQRMPQNPAR